MSLSEKGRSKSFLQQAKEVISEHDLPKLTPYRLLQEAGWQSWFGYRDSVHFFLDQLLALPDLPQEVLGDAYRIYATNINADIPAAERKFRKAFAIYKAQGNYQKLSNAYIELAELYLKDREMDICERLLDTTILYCNDAVARNQDIDFTMARVHIARGKIFKVRGKFEESQKANIKGLRQKWMYWRSSARYEASDARELYRNEQQAHQLSLREQELKAERTRGYGLLGFSVLVLLLSFLLLRLYGKLEKASELSKSQAAALREAKDQLEESLRLQIMLKAELKHRVKNNMQLIMSIFNRGRRDIEDPELKSALDDRKEQIQSIALLHQKIDLESDDRKVDPEEYLGELVTNIEKSYSGVFPEVRLNLDLNVDLLHVDMAVPLGLILNELVTNAYKYAFPKGGPGSINVSFSKLPDHFYLRVADDGVGLPEDVNSRRHNSMGTRLIRGLTRQLDGTIEWVPSTKGTVVQLQFQAGDQDLEL